jgi:micrococcal nuclease
MNSYRGIYAMSNHRRRFFFFAFFLFISFLIFLDKSYFKTKLQSKASSQTQNKNLDLEKYHSKNFLIISVVDGDTLDINSPDGQKEFTRIRLLGIDAPEIKIESGAGYFGIQAANFAKESSLGKRADIYLDEGSETRDKYGRLLAYIQLQDGSFLNEIMLSEGCAYADTRFKHSFYNKYKQLESLAKRNKKGLWENITPEQLPYWMQ